MADTIRAMRIGTSTHLMFWCPGCDSRHSVSVNFDAPDKPAKRQWRWNGSREVPTFFPSILATWYRVSAEGLKMIEDGTPLADGVERYPGTDVRCHSFVEGGYIRYLSDCTHELAGKTVELPDIENLTPR